MTNQLTICHSNDCHWGVKSHQAIGAEVELIVLHLTGFPADIDQPSADYENDFDLENARSLTEAG